MYSMYIGSVLRMRGRFGGLLRFIIFFLLGLLLLCTFAPAATFVYTPVQSETVRWYYGGNPTGKWQSLKYDSLFLADVRETTVAQTLFEIPAFDLDSVVSITYRVAVPETFGINFLEYIKVYGVEGDPAPSSAPFSQVPGRSLLYSAQPRLPLPTPVLSPIPKHLEFDLTNAIRKTKLDVGNPEGFRIDFTAYLPGDGALPLKNAELVIQTVPEPSTHLFLLGASGIMFSRRGWMASRRFH